MNLLFGAQSPEQYARLAQAVSARFDISPQTAWQNGDSIGGYSKTADDDPIGQAVDTSSGVSLTILGIINLSKRGLASTADADAKIALQAYLDGGIHDLSQLEGQFLIALTDPRNKSLLILPDSNGLRSAYYTENTGQLAYATNLGTLADSCAPHIKPDETYQNFFLSHGFFPFNHTAYEGIKQIPTGHVLIAQNNSVTLRKTEHLNPWAEKLTQLNFESMSEAAIIKLLDQAFDEAIRDQLSPDQKVGVLLGGFDSALVAAYLAKTGKEVHTYSFHYDDASYNQAHTDTVAKHLGCKHHWIPINADTIKRGLKEFDLYFNAPTNWLNYVIQTEEVCRQIRKDGIRHVYSGDGCDAAFLGYPRVHKTSQLFKHLGRWPNGLIQAITKVCDVAWLENLTGRPYTVAMHLLRTLGRDMPERGFLTMRIFDKNSVRHMRHPHYRAAVEDDETLLKKIAAPLAGKSADRIAYGGKGFLSPNRSKIIGSSDSSSVVIQAPYLHPGLKALALHLPDELCRPKENTKSKETGKYILMRMAEINKLLPTAAIYQKKIAAVDAPIDDWLKNDLKTKNQEYLKDLPFTINATFRDALLRKKIPEELHRRYIASDSLTTHGLSLLLTYSRFTRINQPK